MSGKPKYELFIKRLNMDSLLCRMTDAQLEKVLES